MVTGRGSLTTGAGRGGGSWSVCIAHTHAVALRILQEGLTNVLRHAAAHRLVVRLHFLPGEHFTLALGDDGQGFDVAAALAGGLSERNVGLHGMSERAELMGGRLRLRSGPGRGTTLRLWL